MRIYYIFLIKKEIMKENKNVPENLYKVLESIYLMNNDDIILGYKLFNKICEPVDKDKFNNLIFDINKHNMNYMKFNNTHVLNDFMSNENTKLTINNAHIKIKSNENYPSFFKDIKNMPNLFVCDFINMDYFFLSEIELHKKIVV